MNTPLNTFPKPLRRLILCGGGGLALAWGPLRDGVGITWPWDPFDADIAIQRGSQWSGDSRTPTPLTAPECWSIPLEDYFPWPARLATVAAWMLGRSGVGVWIGDNDVFVTLNIATDRNTIIQVAWHRSTGQRYVGSVPTPSLPTLPQHLASHPVAVSLLLALYDVPEIKTRVDAVNS